uniref:Uncharacterized protein n=1 Tax=Nelumbo nucifera TaxID=4432 RepID=A0A822Y9L4_NELNU|nr:TPA_asm: hypothetical protein HUJ06_027746 [Nelumbo nucifera]
MSLIFLAGLMSESAYKILCLAHLSVALFVAGTYKIILTIQSVHWGTVTTKS